MKVLYDHQIFSIQSYGGISRYFYELMNIFDITKDVEFRLSLIHSSNEYLRKIRSLEENGVFNKKPYKLKYISSLFGARNDSYQINQNFSQTEISTGDYDVFHPTYYDSYFLEHISEKPFVLTVHDMIHEIYPELFPNANVTISKKKRLIEAANEIICVSNNTKDDLLSIYNDLDASRIHVIYHGNSLNPSFTAPLLIDQNPGPQIGKYLLYVGTRWSYKNFSFFIQSTIRLLKKYPWLTIVCVGGGKFTSDELQFFDQNGIISRVYQYSVNDAQLASFYKNSLAFVFPSIYEGFGIPILEAFACRCPTICSNTSSLPEVAKDAAVYFNPKDILSIQRAIESIILDGELRVAIVDRGSRYLQDYDWNNAAKLTKNVYNEAIST